MIRKTLIIWISFIAILMGYQCEMSAQEPKPEIQINNSDKPFTLTQADTLTVSVALDNNGIFGRYDWWFAANAPFGLFFYTLESGWTTSVIPIYQGNLFSLPAYELISIPLSSMPIGAYSFYFGLDASADGVLTEGSLVYDTATGNIVASGNTITKEIKPAGGEISILNSRGDQVTLTIPEDALKEAISISLTALETPLKNPISRNIFPGVIIQPQGLMLQEPAKLSISYASPQSSPEQLSLFHLKHSDFVIPIGRQESNVLEIYGEIYHFSDYFVGLASGSEVIAQANQGLEILSLTPNNWQFTYENTYGLLELAGLLQGMGRDNEAQEYIDAAISALAKDAANFLAWPMPDEPCGDYANTLFKYAAAVMSLIGPSQLEVQFQERIIDLLNRCSFRGSLDITHFLTLCPPYTYTATVTVPFYVETFATETPSIVGSSASATGSIVAVCDEECPISMNGSLYIKNVGGELEADSQGNLSLHFKYQVKNPIDITYCTGLSIPGSDNWWSTEVVIPAIDGYEYTYGAYSAFRFKLHIKAFP